MKFDELCYNGTVTRAWFLLGGGGKELVRECFQEEVTLKLSERLKLAKKLMGKSVPSREWGGGGGMGGVGGGVCAG